jgi:hypothetical protein
LLGIDHNPLEQGLEVAQQALNGSRVKQIRVVITLQQQCLVVLNKIEVEIVSGETDGLRKQLGLQLKKRG